MDGALSKLLDDFDRGRDSLRAKSEGDRFDEIVRFHHSFLRIHPFADGNGRTARFLLHTHLREFSRLEFDPALLDRERYLRALQEADSGSPAALALILRASCTACVDTD